MSKWCPKTVFSSKIWPNPGCGFRAIFEIVGPPVKGFQKGIKDFRGAIKSLQRAIKSAQKAIKIPQKRSGAPRDLFSHWQRNWQDLHSHPSKISTGGSSREIFGAVRRAFIHLRLV